MNEDEKTVYLLFHTKEGDVLMGHSPIFSDTSDDFIIEDVLALREAYTPASHVPVIMFAKYIPYAKNWSFRFKIPSLTLAVSTEDIQEAFILFYEWCRISIKEDQTETIDLLLMSYMESKGVDYTKLIQKPGDKYLLEKFISGSIPIIKADGDKGEPADIKTNILNFSRKKDDPTLH